MSDPAAPPRLASTPEYRIELKRKLMEKIPGLQKELLEIGLGMAPKIQQYITLRKRGYVQIEAYAAIQPDVEKIAYQTILQKSGAYEREVKARVTRLPSNIEIDLPAREDEKIVMQSISLAAVAGIDMLEIMHGAMDNLKDMVQGGAGKFPTLSPEDREKLKAKATLFVADKFLSPGPMLEAAAAYAARNKSEIDEQPEAWLQQIKTRRDAERVAAEGDNKERTAGEAGQVPEWAQQERE